MHSKEKTLYYISSAASALIGLVIGIYSFMNNDINHGIMGIAAPLFSFFPFILKKLGIKPVYKLYTLLFVFIIIAYDIGCAAAGYNKYNHLDTFCHFISGILFSVIGMCLYLFFEKHSKSKKVYSSNYRDELKSNWLIPISYALFFSAFIAVSWEIIEFLDFSITGHDGQHHLTTGVVDTMEDLISCTLGSIVFIVSYLLFVFDKWKGLSPFFVEDFYLKNIKQ